MVQVVWSDGFLIFAVYALVAVIVKPLIGLFLPQSNTYQDNAVRVAGFLIAYVLVLGNHVVVTHFTWPQAWGLIPIAVGVYATAALTYHITDTPGPTPPAQSTPPVAEMAHVDPSEQTSAHVPRATTPHAVAASKKVTTKVTTSGGASAINLPAAAGQATATPTGG